MPTRTINSFAPPCRANYPERVNIYEHGIASETDEWAGSLRCLATTQPPIYSGFTKTILDLNGRSLNERAVHLAEVNGACYTADYFEEKDLRYCVLATLYHLNRIIDLTLP